MNLTKRIDVLENLITRLCHVVHDLATVTANVENAHHNRLKILGSQIADAVGALNRERLAHYHVKTMKKWKQKKGKRK